MNVKKSPHAIVVGLALFSMFFGSGNLIFPLMLGRDAGDLFYISAISFILSAVIIPFLGVLAIIKAQGNYRLIFERILNKKLSFALILFSLICFIPLGAGPRCVILAHASLKQFIYMPPLWLFSILFLSFIAYLVLDKRHILDVLGKILTPALLLCVAIMVIASLYFGHLNQAVKDPWDIALISLFEGYNTQDLFSALFFSSTLVNLINHSFSDKKKLRITLLKAGILGCFMLMLLYVLLILASAYHSQILIGESGINLVSLLAKQTLGKFGIIASLAVALACLTTALALVLAFKDFLQTSFKLNNSQALILSIGSIFFTSLIKFEGITAIISPILKVFYPIILLLVIIFLLMPSKLKINL